MQKFPDWPNRIPATLLQSYFLTPEQIKALLDRIAFRINFLNVFHSKSTEGLAHPVYETELDYDEIETALEHNSDLEGFLIDQLIKLWAEDIRANASTRLDNSILVVGGCPEVASNWDIRSRKVKLFMAINWRLFT